MSLQGVVEIRWKRSGYRYMRKPPPHFRAVCHRMDGGFLSPISGTLSMRGRCAEAQRQGDASLQEPTAGLAPECAIWYARDSERRHLRAPAVGLSTASVLDMASAIDGALWCRRGLPGAYYICFGPNYFQTSLR